MAQARVVREATWSRRRDVSRRSARRNRDTTSSTTDSLPAITLPVEWAWDGRRVWAERRRMGR